MAARDLLELDEATARLRPSRACYVGVRPVKLSEIVGTDSRARDFDRAFNARRPELRRRREQVERAFPSGAFPPIVVSKLGNAYFVVDGHHRVAAARRRGAESIDAEVTELTARWHLGPDADATELVHAEQERIFMTESGLAVARPDLRLRLSRAVGYRQLLESVQLHGYRLVADAPRALDRAEVASDWHARIYRPTVDAIHTERLDEVCPEVTDPDRFLWVVERRRELETLRGRTSLEDAVRRATQELARERRGVRRLLRLRRGRAAQRTLG